VTTHDGRAVSLGLWDTAGQDEYAAFRPLSYENADCMLLAFSCDSRASYESVEAKWAAELRSTAPAAPDRVGVHEDGSSRRGEGRGESCGGRGAAKTHRRDGVRRVQRVDATRAQGGV